MCYLLVLRCAPSLQPIRFDSVRAHTTPFRFAMHSVSFRFMAFCFKPFRFDRFVLLRGPSSGIIKGGFWSGELVIGPMGVPGGSLTVPSAYRKVRSQPPPFANPPFNNRIAVLKGGVSKGGGVQTYLAVRRRDRQQPPGDPHGTNC